MIIHVAEVLYKKALRGGREGKEGRGRNFLSGSAPKVTGNRILCRKMSKKKGRFIVLQRWIRKPNQLGLVREKEAAKSKNKANLGLKGVARSGRKYGAGA